MARLRGAWTGLAVALVLWMARVAVAASAIPEFPRDGTVAVQDVPDSFDQLRRFLKRHRSPVGAKYHVAIVAFSDPLDRPGPDHGDASGDYINRTVEAWRPHVDTENTVLILLALRNRDIIVHPFSKWALLGWEQQAVVDTIDASPFASRARAGDYDSAIQALILAIDEELRTRLEAEARQAQQARELLALTRTRNEGFEDKVREARYDPPAARELHHRALSGVGNAARALEAGEVRKGFQLAQKAADEAAEAERLIATLARSADTARAEQKALHERLGVLEQALASAEFELSDVRPHTETVKKEHDAAGMLLEERRPDEALLRLKQGESALRLAEQAVTHARDIHRFKTRTLPWLIAGAVVLLLLAWLFVLRSRSARRRREAEELLAQWQTLLTRAGDNLVKLEDEHALILGRADLVERFDGASAGPVREAARAVDDVFLAYETAQRLLLRVRETLSAAGPLQMFRERPFDSVIERLSIQELLVRTEDVTERKLFLPEHREVRMSPPELLTEMQAAWDRALHLVEALEARFRHAWAELDRLKEELRSLEELEGRLAGMGVSSPFRDETAKLALRLAELNEAARRDPLGAEEASAQPSLSLSKLLARTERLVEAVSHLREEAHPRHEEGLATLARLRGEGLVVGEPGFEPEVMLSHLRRTSAAAMDAVKGGHDTEAVAHAREAAASGAELLQLCERTYRSRQESPARITELEERVRVLRERLPERRERLAGLRRLHADSALQPALDNAEEASEVLEQAARCLGQARTCVAPGAQCYLAGAELIERAFQLLGSVDGLYQEIETKADELARARQSTEKELAAGERSFADLQRGLSGDDAFASDATLEAYRRLESALPSVRKATEVERPDWLVLCEEARSLASRAHATEERARAERDTWQKALAFGRELTVRRDTYGKVLQSRTDDLEATNIQFREASAELDAALAKASATRPSWPEVLEALQRAAEGLETTNRMAEKDFMAAANARNAVAGAEEAVRSADTHYGHRVKADLHGAREALTSASRLLAARDYAEAARLAEEARKSARSAASRARAEVEYLKDLEREEHDWSRSSSSGSSFSFGGSSSRSSSGSSGSSSSSSGGSSFGSSSGRSSFGSSAGRSKW